MRKILYSLVLLAISSLTFSQLNPGQIGNNQQTCYGSAPLQLNFTIAPSGGLAPYLYRWQRSNDGGSTWVDIAGTNGGRSVYSPPVLGRNAWFRCQVTDNNNSTALTNQVLITVSSDLTAGIIGPDQAIYEGSVPAQLAETVPATGGGGSFTYRWQSSQNGLQWSDIPGAVAANFTPSQITSTTLFRRWVIDNSCGSTASNSVRITIINAVTLYTTEIPFEFKTYGLFDLGTRFEVLSSGIITKARLFTSVDEEGSYQVRLWEQTGPDTWSLVYGPFLNWNLSAGVVGWREFTFPSPIIVENPGTYMISITSPSGSFAHSPDFTPIINNEFINYLGGNLTSNIGTLPNSNIGAGDSYFRDIVFVPFSPGTAGVSQRICYNNAPAAFTQSESPSGGFGEPYSFQWQSSTEGTNWTNIPNAISPDYSAPTLTNTTYFRRVVTSGGISINGPQVVINVDVPFISSQLASNMTIVENSSTFLNIGISGGTPPYTINYTCNGVSQPPLTNYTSGTDFFTGILSSGNYIYSLTSVSDAFGCHPGSLGNPITVSATMTETARPTNKVLLIVNSQVDELYDGFMLVIKPYFDWFGIPIDLWDIGLHTSLPDFNEYALIVFGHDNVYDESYVPDHQKYYPINELETALSNGVGLYSFDSHLFDSESLFVTPGGNQAVTSSQININPGHFITEYHQVDEYDSANNIINLKPYATVSINAADNSLTNHVNLATMSEGIASAPLLQVGTSSSGRIVKWGTYTWMYDSYLGPAYGMDDLIWRSIVWAAKKPFVMQGVPPMITMRIDDVNGLRTNDFMLNLEWLDIANEFGFKPWLGLLNNELQPSYIDKLRGKILNEQATASPHAAGYDDFIFYNVNSVPNFNSRTNILNAWNFFTVNNLPVSNYVLPHFYLMDEQAVDALGELGVEFIGNVISFRDYPLITNPDLGEINYPGPWLNGGPYRINREGTANRGQPVFYAGNVNLSGNNFFNVLSEIGDDGPPDLGYEWYPSIGTNTEVINRGVRHLRRALNGMFLPVLFTHEDQIRLYPENWRQILSGVTSGVASYGSEYMTTDEAVRYLRAKENIEIVNVVDYPTFINISCSGINDMETKCYLFYETAGHISFRIVSLPMVTSTSIPVTTAVLK